MKLFTKFIIVVVLLLSFLDSPNIAHSIYYFEDDFTNISKWNIIPNEGDPLNTWVVNDGKLESKVKRGVSSYLSPKELPYLKNYRITLLSKNVSGIDQIYQFRVKNDGMNYYHVSYRFNDSSWPDNNNIILYKSINNEINEIARYTPTSTSEVKNIQQGLINRIRIEVENRTIKIYINDSNVINYFDGDNNYIVDGYVRMLSWAGDNYKVDSINNYDNFLISDIEDQINYGSWDLTPIKYILIPGMGASWNTEAMVYNHNVANADWRMTPFVHNYDLLEDGLRANGLVKNSDYFVWNYDWRKDINETVDEFDTFVNQKIGSSGEVNIVGHSLGGLIGRLWLQKGNDSKTNKVISLGSPHQGSLKAYDAWNGTVTGNNNEASAIALKILLKLQSKLGKSDVEILRQYSPSLGQLVPVYDFLRKNGEMVSASNIISPNLTMVVWNNNLSNIWTDFEAVAGDGVQTKSVVDVGNRRIYDRVLGKWEDGSPTGYEYVNDGDGTVISNSAKLDPGNGVFTVIASDHGKLPDNTVNLVLSKFGLGTTIISSQTEEETKLIFYLGSPARLEVNCGNGTLVSDEMGFVIIDENESDNSCEVKVIGTGDGTYHLVMGRSDELDSWKYFEGDISANEIKTVNFEVVKPMISLVNSKDYLKMLVEADLDKLLILFPQDNNILAIRTRLNEDNYTECLGRIFRMRREKSETDISTRVIDNLAVLLGSDQFNSVQTGELKSEAEALLDTVGIIENLKIQSDKLPSQFGARSYVKFEEYMQKGDKYADEDNYGQAYANYETAKNYLYEVW